MRIHRDSILWLVGAVVAFTVAVLAFTPLRMTLSWDETVYASQISQHVPIMRWGPERARGMPLLVAPVTLLTGSATTLRVYLALLAGAALLVALLAWRGLRPAWVLGLAGVIFGGLAIVQSQATRLYPNYWIAIGGLAGAGLALQAMTRQKAPRWAVICLAVAGAYTALMRPPDAVIIFAPLAVIAMVVMRRRSVPVVLAIAAGVGAGGLEWVAEAYMYFHGPFARLHSTSNAVGGTKFDPVTSLRILNGERAASVPGYPGVHGWSYPGLLLWWAALLGLVLIGVYAAGRLRAAGPQRPAVSDPGAGTERAVAGVAGGAPSLTQVREASQDREAAGAGITRWLIAATPVICALSVYILYSLPVRDNARYLQPTWALLSIPAADGVAWLARTPGGKRRIAIAAATAFLAVEFVSQHVVLGGIWAGLRVEATAEGHAAQGLRALGVHAPCVLTTVRRPHFAPVVEPVAYQLGCNYLGTIRHARQAGNAQVVVLVQGAGHPWPYAAQWPAHKLQGSGGVTAYVGAPAVSAVAQGPSH